MISYSENTAMYYLSEEKADKQGICFLYENYPQRLYLNAISSKAEQAYRHSFRKKPQT